MEKTRNRKQRPAWRGNKPKQLTKSLCVHCGKPLQSWELLQNAFYHAACILQIKRSGL